MLALALSLLLGGMAPQERECIALTVYHEARGEILTGQTAVAAVVINRTASGLWPDTPCSVVYQTCQFSWTCDQLPDVPKERTAWLTALAVTDAYLEGRVKDPTRGSTCYHNLKVQPSWSQGTFIQIGNHRFYRCQD